MKTSATWAGALSLMVLSAPATHADTLALTPVRDNTLFEDNGASSNGAGPLFIGQIASGSPRRALLKFDLSSLPVNAEVTSVTLRFVIDRAAIGSGNDTTALHRVLNDWGEGTSSVTGGGGAAATAEDATWTHRYYGTPAGSGPTWSTPGGDYIGAASGTTTVLSIGPYTFAQQPGMVADVQAWAANPAINHGWIMFGPEGDAAQNARRIRSRETPGVADRPTLTIEYTTVASPIRQVPLPFWLPFVALPMLARITARHVRQAVTPVPRQG